MIADLHPQFINSGVYDWFMNPVPQSSSRLSGDFPPNKNHNFWGIPHYGKTPVSASFAWISSLMFSSRRSESFAVSTVLMTRIKPARTESHAVGL